MYCSCPPGGWTFNRKIGFETEPLVHSIYTQYNIMQHHLVQEQISKSSEKA